MWAGCWSCPPPPVGREQHPVGGALVARPPPAAAPGTGHRGIPIVATTQPLPSSAQPRKKDQAGLYIGLITKRIPGTEVDMYGKIPPLFVNHIFAHTKMNLHVHEQLNQ